MMGKGIRQNFGRVSFTRSITIEDRGQGLAILSYSKMRVNSDDSER
jgi:hypothetical protein